MKLYEGTCNEDNETASLISREALHLLICSLPPSFLFVFSPVISSLCRPMCPLLRLFLLQAPHSLFCSPAPSVLFLFLLHLSISLSVLLLVIFSFFLLHHCLPAKITKTNFWPWWPVDCHDSSSFSWANHSLDEICSCCRLSGRM